METITLSVDLTAINCGECGGTYAINERYRRQKQEDGSTWHCPYCGVSWGFVEGENAKLKKQIAQLQTTVEHKDADISSLRTQRDSLERSRAALRAVHTRTCNRVKNGVCPCCNRYIKQLARHMASKHPDYKAGISA